MDIQWDMVKDDLFNSLLNEDVEHAHELSQKTLELTTPEIFFELCITPVLKEIGDRFERLEIFLPEMIFAAEVIQSINKKVIQPRIEASQGGKIKSQGKVLIATIEGDLHDIGKNMVALMLQVNGFEVIDLGVDVSPKVIVEKAEQENVDIIGLSSLLTSCLPYMKDVVDLLNAKGLRERYEVIIGGAAPTPEYAHKIGVDAQGHTAVEAVAICKELMTIKAGYQEGGISYERQI
jgi:trimethylamine corrinoid protein